MMQRQAGWSVGVLLFCAALTAVLYEAQLLDEASELTDTRRAIEEKPSSLPVPRRQRVPLAERSNSHTPARWIALGPCEEKDPLPVAPGLYSYRKLLGEGDWDGSFPAEPQEALFSRLPDSAEILLILDARGPRAVVPIRTGIPGPVLSIAKRTGVCRTTTGTPVPSARVTTLMEREGLFRFRLIYYADSQGEVDIFVPAEEDCASMLISASAGDNMTMLPSNAAEIEDDSQGRLVLVLRVEATLTLEISPVGVPGSLESAVCVVATMQGEIRNVALEWNRPVTIKGFLPGDSGLVFMEPPFYIIPESQGDNWGQGRRFAIGDDRDCRLHLRVGIGKILSLAVEDQFLGPIPDVDIALTRVFHVNPLRIDKVFQGKTFEGRTSTDGTVDLGPCSPGLYRIEIRGKARLFRDNERRRAITPRQYMDGATLSPRYGENSALLTLGRGAWPVIRLMTTEPAKVSGHVSGFSAPQQLLIEARLPATAMARELRLKRTQTSPGAGGQFSMNKLPPGNLVFVAMRNGRELARSQPIDLAAGRLQHIEIARPPSGRVEVVLLGPTVSFSGWEVVLEARDANVARSPGQPVVLARQPASRKVVFEDVSPGTCFASLKVPDDAGEVAEERGRVVRVRPDTVTRLSLGYSSVVSQYEVQILRADSSPVAGAVVYLDAVEPSVDRSLVLKTDSSGLIHFKSGGTETYEISGIFALAPTPGGGSALASLSTTGAVILLPNQGRVQVVCN